MLKWEESEEMKRGRGMGGVWVSASMALTPSVSPARETCWLSWLDAWFDSPLLVSSLLCSSELLVSLVTKESFF
jgi:hypothetical protein